MVYDSLIDSLKFDWKRTLKYYSPVIVCLSMFMGITTLPIYNEQRGLVYIMCNYTLACITLNLMLHNMAGKPFSPLQPAILLLVVPFVSKYSITPLVDQYYNYFYDIQVNRSDVELIIPQVITVFAWLVCVGKIAILSKQWGDFSQKPFWHIRA